jgi:hypothetical protein
MGMGRQDQQQIPVRGMPERKATARAFATIAY